MHIVAILDTFHKSKLGLLVFGVIELALVWLFANLAIDRGNLWWYLLTLIFLIGTIQNFVKLIKESHHDNSER